MKEIKEITNEEYYNKCLKANKKLLELIEPYKRIVAKYDLMDEHIELLYEDIKTIKRSKKEIEAIAKKYGSIIV